MRDHRSRDASGDSSEVYPTGIKPGAVTLTQHLPVQRKARRVDAPTPVEPFAFVQAYNGEVRSSSSALFPDDVPTAWMAADAGTSGSARSLPHLETIQPLFGKHDVSHVRAYTDENAAAGAAALGAEAYAVGDRVAFGTTPSLHTAAHEAAHVVQQRAGVSLKSGVSTKDDVYEQHADAVADRVVRGESAVDLLDQYAGTDKSSDAPPRGGVIQRVESSAPVAAGTRVRVTAAPATQPAADPATAFRDASSGGGGALPFREDMERAFGQELGSVTAYLGRDEALRDTGMTAATSEDRVVFGDASPSRELVAHEVAHVVQQRGSVSAGEAATGVSRPDDAAEREADAVASRAAVGERVSVSASASAAIHPHRAKVIDAKHELVGQIFDVVGGSSAGHVYIRLTDGRQVTLDPGTYELLPDEDREPKKTKKRKKTASQDKGSESSSSQQSLSSHPAFDLGSELDFGEGEFDDDIDADPLDAKIVIIQADFMSGDRYGIAAALTLDKRVGVIILTAPSTRAKAEDMKRFYDAVLEKIGSETRRIGIVVVADPHRAYVERESLSENDTFSSLVGGANAVSATFGTQLVADNLGHYGTDGPNGVPAYLAQTWLDEPRGDKAKKSSKVDPVDDQHAKREQALQGWLLSKKMLPAKYAIIWAKTGSPDAEKAHHFTSPVAAKQLIDLALKLGRIPVLVGDDIGVAQHLAGKGILLGEFWNDGTYPFRDEGRLGQLRLYRFLTTCGGYDAVNIGMRSGGLEGPALMGMQTIYLEEEGNLQARRMEKWLKVLPNFHRVILASTPGGPQRLYLAGIIADKIRRVSDATPDIKHGEFFIDDIVPYTLRDEYVAFLRLKMEYLKFQAEMGKLMVSMEGFEVDDLTNVADLLERSQSQLATMDESDDPAFSTHSPSYAELFLKAKGVTTKASEDVEDRSKDRKDKDKDKDKDEDRGKNDKDTRDDSRQKTSASSSTSQMDLGSSAKGSDVTTLVLERLGQHHSLMGSLGGFEQVRRVLQTSEGPMLWEILQVFEKAEDQLAKVLSSGRYMSITQVYRDVKEGTLVRK